MNKLPVIAAFDFDGTITYRDSLLPFLFYTHGYLKSLWNFFLCSPTLLAYVVGLSSRQQTKERILQQFYKGLTLSELQKWSKEYAENGIKVKPEAIERIHWHQNQGHRCVLVSASIDVYLEPWAKRMGFSDVLCSRIEVDANQKLTGKLQGLNCRAQEKVNRLNQLLGPKADYILYAYGDSKGDKEMLDYADYPFYRRFG